MTFMTLHNKISEACGNACTTLYLSDTTDTFVCAKQYMVPLHEVKEVSRLETLYTAITLSWETLA